jgi:hypothetical protein
LVAGEVKIQASLQKREISPTQNQDLKEEISLVKRQGYERMLKQASDLLGLLAIERQVRVDSRLTQHDRALLLSAVAGWKRKPESQALVEPRGDLVTLMHAPSWENTSHPLCGAKRFKSLTMIVQDVNCEGCIRMLDRRGRR